MSTADRIRELEKDVQELKETVGSIVKVIETLNQIARQQVQINKQLSIATRNIVIGNEPTDTSRNIGNEPADYR